MSGWSGYLENTTKQYVDDLCDLLRIPSISTDPAYAGHVKAAAQWIAEKLVATGIENVSVLDTALHPVVYGDWLHAPGKPTIILYGHYDVQPPDPLEKWDTPPFTPVIDGDCIRARGASDMKGNLLLPINACAALLATTGKLPLNVKFLFEGEEEINSPSLPALLASQRARFASDMLICADGGQYGPGQPGIVTGLRGLCSLQVNVKSADTDLHSGMMGGIAPNAIHALATMLASLRDPAGRILVDGFYQHVQTLTADERQQIAALAFDEKALLAETGMKALCGEPEYPPKARIGWRPTLEVNGIWGGYQGEGTKTVIPCEAHAKITCRLVPNQDPTDILDRVGAHLRRHAPAEVDVDIELPKGAPAYSISADHPGLQAAAKVLTAAYGREPYYSRTGGSVALTTIFQEALGVDTILFGFSLPGANIHAPNEFASLENLLIGRQAYCQLMLELGGNS